MGWKTASIIAGECPYGYLGTFPSHSPAKADEVISELGYGGYSNREKVKLETYPASGSFVIGAYDKATFVADQDLIFKCFENRNLEYFKRAMNLYPEGNLLLMVLHSSNNYFGYAYYEAGSLVREYSGSMDFGLVSEYGEVQPEERAAFDRSRIENGNRVFYAEIGKNTHEFSVDAYGSALTFFMAQKFFDQPLNRSRDGIKHPRDLDMELFRKS